MPKCRKCHQSCDEAELHSVCHKSDNHEIWCNDCIRQAVGSNGILKRSCVLCNSKNVIHCDFEYLQDEIREVNYVEDGLDGENIKIYYNERSTQVHSIGNYRKGIKYGFYVTFNEDGNKSLEENYNQNGVLHGECKKYNKYGILQSIENYEDGLLDGIQKYYDDFHNIVREVNYKSGVKSGSTTHYSIDRESKSTYISSIEWYENNKLQNKVTYYPGNRIQIKATYKDNKLDGEYIMYEKDGSVLLNGIYKDGAPYNGKLFGQNYLYDKDRNILFDGKLFDLNDHEIINYKDGVIEGEYICYHDSERSKISMITPYVNGKKHGIEKKFDENGNLIYSVEYQDDKKHGIEKRFCTNGNISSTMEYQNGMKYGKSQTFIYKKVVKKFDIHGIVKKKEMPINNLINEYANSRILGDQIVAGSNAPMINIGSNEVPGIIEDSQDMIMNMNCDIMNTEDEFMKLLQERGF